MKQFVIIISLFCLSLSSFGQADTSGIENLLRMPMDELMNQKVVTASKYMQSSAEAASSIGTITAYEIKNFGYKTLGEALNSQRGMFLSNDRNYIYVGSRGFSRPTDYNNRILIMVDGHIMNEIVYGSGTINNELGVNLDNVERIEIIRGPGASVYGSGSMLNIVNLIMKKGADINGLSASSGLSSFGTGQMTATYGKKSGKTDFLIAGTGGFSDGENFYFSEMDSPLSNNGISKGNDWEKFAGFQTSVTHKGFKLSALYCDRIKGIPTGAFQTDLTGGSKTRDARFFIESDYNRHLNSHSNMAFRLYYDNYAYVGSYASTGLASNDASTGRWIGSELQYYLEAGGRNVITAGAEFKYVFRADYREWDPDTTYFNHNFPFSFFSFYGQDQLTIAKNLNFTAGFRYDKYSVFGGAFSPRLALTFKYSSASSLKLLYGEAFRIPNVYEAFYESYNSHEKNPGIKPEKIRTIELAWTQKIMGSLYGSMSLYSFTTYNLIDQVLQTNGLTTFMNIGQVTGTGAEYGLRYLNDNKGTDVYINFSLQKAIDRSTHEFLTNSPEFMLKSGIILKIPRILNIVPEFYYESGRKTLKGNRTSDVYLFNLGLNSVTILKHFDLALKVKNIFDRKVYYPAGYEHVQDVLPQERRNIGLKVTAHF
jgi:outer membrane receptor for ferrienterochelin and colicins